MSDTFLAKVKCLRNRTTHQAKSVRIDGSGIRPSAPPSLSIGRTLPHFQHLPEVSMGDVPLLDFIEYLAGYIFSPFTHNTNLFGNGPFCALRRGPTPANNARDNAGVKRRKGSTKTPQITQILPKYQKHFKFDPGFRMAGQIKPKPPKIIKIPR